MHLGELPSNAARRFGPREALVFGEERWTFDEFNASVERVARALIATDIGRGDRVAVWMVNRPEWLFTMFALARVGAVIVPLNTRYRADDLHYTLAQSRSKLLLTHVRSGPVEFLSLLCESAPELVNADRNSLALGNYPELKTVVTLETSSMSGVLSFDEWLSTGDGVSDSAVDDRFATLSPEDDMIIMYTSGTTGHPKGAVHSHAPVRNTVERMQLYEMSASDTQMSYLPLFHIYGYSEIAMGSVAVGARQILMETFDAERVLDLAAHEGATVLHGFDAHWLDLLRVQRAHPRALSLRVNTCPSGMASSAQIAGQIETVFGPTLSGWGMSEAWAFVACSRPSDSVSQRTEASGAPMAGYEFKVVDPDSGNTVSSGVAGELCVRGYTVMRGYFDKPSQTQEVIDQDGWLHTGDMCHLRPDGHVVFMGRYRDVLKVGGENVSPAEIEARLLDLEYVKDAAVVGVADERLQEVVVAFVLTDAPDRLSEAAVIESMRGRIASFKLPKHVFFEQNFPMTPSGKVRKVELRALARARLS